MESKFKAATAALVQNISDFFEVSLEIRLFGVRVFSFVWPPRKEQNSKQL